VPGERTAANGAAVALGVPIDGHQFIPAAVKAGCCAVICEDPALVPAGVATVVVRNTRRAAGLLAQSIRGWPARKLATIGITGTNGKSTSTYLVRAVLEAAGYKPGLIGTIGYETGKRSQEASNTTPGPVELAEITAEMVAAGKTHLVMEVSSHALDQDRVAGLEFQVGAFTNLTGDHLDYHKTMERYLLAKQRLFEQLPASGFAILNRDDVAWGQLSRATKAGVITYGLCGDATLGCKIVGFDSDGTAMEMIWQGKSYSVRTPLIGRHNVYNSLCAGAACLALGLGPQLVAAALGNVSRVPGRLERVDAPAPYKVFVDYAHTDDALENVLTAMRKVTAGRLIVLFGCGGDRDRTKRPRMAKVAQKADAVVVTSDNPRTEEAQSIIDEILAGFDGDGAAKVTVEPDRRAAIGLAISMARNGDLVLLAGKGHENYQIIGKTKHHFDDVEVAKEMMREGTP
jgi:UDP-N-acetylmuramoyl-L-alanyl-D-glutamate--2,6-diaminopimelate ligase